MRGTPLPRGRAHAPRDRSGPAVISRVSRSPRALWAAALASAFLDGDWTRDGLLRRGTIVVGHARPELRELVRRVLRGYPRPPWDRPRELGAWIGASGALDGV